MIENVIKYSPRAIIIVVANPMDTLTYLALKASGLPKNRIIGMGGALDSARFKCYLAKARALTSTTSTAWSSAATATRR